jgi:fumarate hydratase subunit alpha
MERAMREIRASDIADAVARLSVEANYHLGEDVVRALTRALEQEESPVGREVLQLLLENARLAAEGVAPLCQDCGVAVVFVDLGQDVHIVGGDLHAAIEEGVRRGYKEGYLRKSMVRQPFSARVNTGDNTPPVVYVDVVPGDRVRLTVAPKGAGSENMSALAMLKPADGRAGVVDFVVRTVDRAGANPCPPIVVGVGVGGTAERALLLAKRALLRELGTPHPDPEVADLEREILARVNDLGIGPQGLGGRITALAVHVEVMPCHMGSLPVGVNIQCHSARHKEVIL